MWHWNDGPDGWVWFWMVAMMAVVWLPLLLATIWALAQLGRRGASGQRDRNPDTDARELARRAYARGEIDRDRYLELMRDLDPGGARGGQA